MSAITECDENQEQEDDDDGYLSDPTYVDNPNELDKLYRVAPKLKEGLGIPLNQLKKHN